MDEINHLKALRTLCRVCGDRCIKQPQAKYEHGIEKDKFSERLQMKYGIQVTLDDTSIHPQYLCLSCIADANIQSRPSSRPVIEWNGHGPDCFACNHLLKTSKGGRRPKGAKVGAKRRKEREEKEEKRRRQREEVTAACSTLMEATKYDHQPSKEMKLVATNILKSLMQNSESDIIELPTGGPKLVMQKLTIPKIPSNMACKTTVRNRTKFLKKMLQLISSPDEAEEAAVHQLASLLKGCSSEDLHQMMEVAGLLKIKIPAGHELAMKAKYGWTWEFMRSLKRWLNAYKISFVCEGNTRQAKGDILKASNISKEMLPFFHRDDKETITKLSPMVSIPDVPGHIMHTLDELDKLDLLTWDGIPQDEVWVKIGGDGGGGSTKFYYQILNVTKPNSRNNSTVFVAYGADESLPNLHIALDRYREQINGLNTAEWRGKKIVPWLCADYLLICKLLGLQGASATYPCMCCLAKKGELLLETPRSAEARSLDTIMDDYVQVEAQHFTANAKRANNSVSHKPFFDIPLDQVCIPSLHISLGLWNKFYNLLEEDVGTLGNVIAHRLSEESQEEEVDNLKFRNHINKLKEVRKEIVQKRSEAETLRDEMNTMEYSLMFQSLSTPVLPSQEQMEQIQCLHEKAQQLDEEAGELETQHCLEDASNPLLIGMDQSLKKFKVKRQAWHGNTFVGNHVHKCLKKDNYTTLLDDLVNTATGLSDDDIIVDMAEGIRVKYLLLFEHFARCYTQYSKSDPMTIGEINNLEKDINNFVSFYKERFPGKSFPPKFHLLQNHTINFIKKTGLGLGRMAEHGGEQLHHEFNEIGRKMEGSRNTTKCDPDLQHLASTMEEHLIRVDPSLRDVMNMMDKPMIEE